MARIRSIKPDFWEDDVVGTLSRDARLLFVATWNMADDEGLLRWTPVYVKAQAFMYDDDVSLRDVQKFMAELVSKGLVFPYAGGASQQQLAMVVHFHRHQRVNRPQPSKLPPPSLQNPSVRAMYERRDGMICHICGYAIDPLRGGSVDHVKPKSKGGSDYPSNIRAAHLRCNRQKGASEPDSLNDSVSDSLNDSVNESPQHWPADVDQDPAEPPAIADVSAGQQAFTEQFTERFTERSLTEGKGREGKGVGEEGKGRGGSARATQLPQRQRPSTQPPPRCPAHLDDPAPPPCGACADARRLHDTWAKTRPTPAVTSPDCPDHPGQPASRCQACTATAVPAPAGWRPTREDRPA